MTEPASEITTDDAQVTEIVTAELIAYVRSAIDQEDTKTLAEIFEDMHQADPGGSLWSAQHVTSDQTRRITGH